MSKRDVAAFGNDESSLTPGAVTHGQVPKRGKQKDETPSKSDEGPKRQHRHNRAWGYLERSVVGKIQHDRKISGKADAQFANEGEFMPEGGNSAGRTVKPVDPYFVDNFQGRSGQPDNQSINRGKGRT